MNTKPLPGIWWITPDIYSLADCNNLFGLLEKRVKQGIKYVQIRQKHLFENDFIQFCENILNFAKDKDITFIINSEPDTAKVLSVHGCYLDSSILMGLNSRPLSEDYYVGAYCHNLEELKHAEKIGLDFVSLSPVKWTKTHPEDPALGWEQFGMLLSKVSLPVYALGGLNLSDKEEAIKRGAIGIMGIRFDYTA